MVDLHCTPFADLIQRMRLEFRNQQGIFDLPARRWFVPTADEGAPDLSVWFHDLLAGNPSGPASGPQTQWRKTWSSRGLPAAASWNSKRSR
jgi:hypothetical protein